MKHADGKEALDLAEGEVGGWFVHTHSSTQGYVRKVAAALSLSVKIAGV